ncbi:adenosine deaminase [Maribellus sp. CM-23]|uniref:adenosine deaminase n=1 Tax=Maribellus sp. CM-23 TaxID=2781026 RepID=UPI001F3ABA62|nr:adenosine deaminase [Maribellus sp. CM-23]MCE4564048.1 adenosine deaminase [Maribellus sp. CM-23]
MQTENLTALIQAIPKAELHLHIEGTFEPELIFALAERNNIPLKYAGVEALRKAYEFKNLQEFLDIYYQGADVLLHEQDFYDLAMAYLSRCREENIVHTELFFDPQTHTHRGVALETVVNGLQKALDDAREQWGITSFLIPNFLRHLSEEDAISTFKECLPFRDYFVGFGLDSSELGHPPTKFERVFRMVREEGFRVVVHAGEEGPAQNIWDSLNLLHAERIDHGVRSIDDPELLKELAKRQTPLTVCPLSNLKLKVVDHLKDHPLKKLLDAGIIATVNSDDPAYFGGYLNQNFRETAEALKLSKEEILKLAKNSFKASFLSEHEKERWIAELAAF